ncbi:MAG: Lysine-sensitive aspartokinase 3 [Flavobacteriales bacterium]|jgi:aspartate kinase|nr:MAG: Lysine-sensitive aspartokinase 3 [Flavobacteriales bacterium]|tara:strand:+ start:8689 stop:9939 length:1251 start_codon:yes stop_codon:yes gene_type:complete
MRVFKFGGASVKDAEGVKNVVKVLTETGHENTVVVVSAMGKTTNALEGVVEAYFTQPESSKTALQDVEVFHQHIIDELFEAPNSPVSKRVKNLFEQCHTFLANNRSPHEAFVYDQVVSFGELVSTSIICAYLNHIGIAAEWIDARSCIKTDNFYRSAHLDWKRTQLAIQNQVQGRTLKITQGFIGSDDNNFTTTLGREGSDYSAAIFAYCLGATDVTIWKDVPGVLNADPRVFDKTQLLHHISYQEAIELAFYGASVIHPKTLQPLQRKEIPLFVKSFLNPTENGTQVGKGVRMRPEIPCYIVKKGLSLLRLSTRDFSFVVEDNISDIFKLLHEHKMSVDLIQNSAISFSVCINDKYHNVETLLHNLRARFDVQYTPNVTLYTIRHFEDDSATSLLKSNELILEQRTETTLQLVMK